MKKLLVVSFLLTLMQTVQAEQKSFICKNEQKQRLNLVMDFAEGERPTVYSARWYQPGKNFKLLFMSLNELAVVPFSKKKANAVQYAIPSEMNDTLYIKIGKKEKALAEAEKFEIEAYTKNPRNMVYVGQSTLSCKLEKEL